MLGDVRTATAVVTGISLAPYVTSWSETADRAARGRSVERMPSVSRMDVTLRRSLMKTLTLAALLALTLTGTAGAQAPVVVQPSQAPVVVQPAPPSAPPVVIQQTPAPPVVVQPAPPPVAVAPAPQTVQAEDIEADTVQAQTIYAEKIEASEVRGAIHQSDGVKLSGHGDIKTPSLSASVIYAEKIKARTVVADNIYVREIQRR
jgi:hypothetical protein